MQAVILAAGKGERLRPWTDTVPKPLIRIGNKNLLQYKLEALPEQIDEVILVVGYLKEKIKDFFGQEYQGRSIKYVTQNQLNGTGGAVWETRDLIRGKFLVMMGDDIYLQQDMEKCLRHERAILAFDSELSFTGGKITFDEQGNFKEVEEGRHEQGGALNTGLMVLNEDFFNYDPVSLSGKEEYGLPQTLARIARDKNVKVEKADHWLKINDPEDLEKAKKYLLN